MATLTQRLPKNAPGLFYVDATCVDCDLCRSLAPGIFQRDDETSFSYVHRQPANEEESTLATEAMHSCPYDSIGNDAG